MIVAANLAPLSWQTAKMGSVSPAQANSALGYRGPVVYGPDGIAEGAVEIDGVGCHMFEGA